MLFTAKLPESPTFSCLTHRTPRHGSTSQVNHLSHEPLIYARAFMPLALASCLDREVLITLFRLGITYHQPRLEGGRSSGVWRVSDPEPESRWPLFCLVRHCWGYFSQRSPWDERIHPCAFFSHCLTPPTPETVLRHQE